MRHLPFRPDNQISQVFNSGVCTVYRQRNTARPGYAPVRELEEVCRLRYEEQRLGLNRFYQARQADVEVERVLRVPFPCPGLGPTPQDAVRTEDGTLYRVDLVQTVPGVWPRCVDVTLVRFEQDMRPQLPPEPGGTRGGGASEVV